MLSARSYIAGYASAIVISTLGAAHGHLLQKAKPAMSLREEEKWARANLAHTRYVASYGHGKPKRNHARATRWLERDLAETRRLELYGLGPRAAICAVFQPCGKALAVAECESGFSVTARNGQFLGIWQMGDYARAKYGHSSNAYGQTVAAHRYYEDAGWSPWECA